MKTYVKLYDQKKKENNLNKYEMKCYGLYISLLKMQKY